MCQEVTNNHKTCVPTIIVWDYKNSVYIQLHDNYTNIVEDQQYVWNLEDMVTELNIISLEKNRQTQLSNRQF